MTVPAARGRRQAAVKARPFEYSHLDLENLVVALLTSTPRAWPNSLHALGYRMHLFDAELQMLREDGRRLRDVRPDAVAHHVGRNLALVIECKAGTDIGLHQIPEGSHETQDQWAEALSLPRRRMLGGPEVRGLLVSTTPLLEPKAKEIAAHEISWLRVDQAFVVDPDHLPDGRISQAMSALPARPWPRSFVPFSHDTTVAGSLEMVIGSIGPFIVQAAAGGHEFVDAETLARATHAAVWDVTDLHRRKSWVGAVTKALEMLASGRMKELVSYDRVVHRIRIHGVRAGQRPDPASLGRLQRAVGASHKRAQRSRSRVKTAAPPEMQTTLFDDDLT